MLMEDSAAIIYANAIVNTPGDPAQPAAPPSAPKVFISYSRKDIAIVRRLVEALEARQVGAWVDWEGILPTAEWWSEIQAAIEGADAFISVMEETGFVPALLQARRSSGYLLAAMERHRSRAPDMVLQRLAVRRAPVLGCRSRLCNMGIIAWMDKCFAAPAYGRQSIL